MNRTGGNSCFGCLIIFSLMLFFFPSFLKTLAWMFLFLSVAGFIGLNYFLKKQSEELKKRTTYGKNKNDYNNIKEAEYVDVDEDPQRVQIMKIKKYFKTPFKNKELSTMSENYLELINGFLYLKDKILLKTKSESENIFKVNKIFVELEDNLIVLLNKAVSNYNYIEDKSSNIIEKENKFKELNRIDNNIKNLNLNLQKMYLDILDEEYDIEKYEDIKNNFSNSLKNYL